MPYDTIYMPAEKVLEHNGVSIYRDYKDDNINEPATYWYSFDEDDNHVFDVRELPQYKSFESHYSIMIQAIEEGTLKAPKDKE